MRKKPGHKGPYRTGTIWDNTRPYGTIQDHTGPYRTKQDQKGPYMTIWEDMELYRNIKYQTDHKEPQGTIRDHK